LEYPGHNQKKNRVKPVLVGAPGSLKVSFGRNVDEGHDEERGECHDAKIGASMM